MKRLLCLIEILLLTFSMMAQPPKGPANKGMAFGAKPTMEGAVNASDLTSVLAAKPSAVIKVKGKVVEVCKAEGCWLKMETANGPTMIKMKDESFKVPLSLNGKMIVAQGSAVMKENSIETLRHYAEDGGKTKKEIAAIKAPKKEMTMQATGILVL